MSAEPLRPGDRAIDLASLARTAGWVSGLATGALVAWYATGQVALAVAFGLIGAGGGGIVGRILGRVRYTPEGRRLVVKRGPAALQITITTALSASLPAAILVWLGCLTILGGPAPTLGTGAAALAAGVLTGILLGRAASRT
jgi:hypothetical protein